MCAFPRPFRHIAVLFFLLVGAASDAKSAQIELAPTNDPDRNVIVITGEFKVGDDAIFADIAIKAKSAVVLFGSPGGALYPAIQIGKAIRLKGFATFVADGLRPTLTLQHDTQPARTLLESPLPAFENVTDDFPDFSILKPSRAIGDRR